MTDATPHFFTLSILLLGLVALVFAMRYAADAYRGRLEAHRQTAAQTTLDTLHQEVRALAQRIGAIEKLLRDVE